MQDASVERNTNKMQCFNCKDKVKDLCAVIPLIFTLVKKGNNLKLPKDIHTVKYNYFLNILKLMLSKH